MRVRRPNGWPRRGATECRGVPGPRDREIISHEPQVRRCQELTLGAQDIISLIDEITNTRIDLRVNTTVLRHGSAAPSKAAPAADCDRFAPERPPSPSGLCRVVAGRPWRRHRECQALLRRWPVFGAVRDDVLCRDRCRAAINNARQRRLLLLLAFCLQAALRLRRSGRHNLHRCRPAAGSRAR